MCLEIVQLEFGARSDLNRNHLYFVWPLEQTKIYTSPEYGLLNQINAKAFVLKTTLIRTH